MLLIKNLLLACLLIFSSAHADAVKELAEFHLSIEEKFEDVVHLKAKALATMDSENIVLFDVRETAEYEISHLPNAIQVSPDISRDDFLKLFGDMIGQKTVVFYCSVGYRSSVLAEDTQNGIRTPVYNLEGGVFNWHNQRRQLVNQSGPTDYVHPFDQHWGRLLSRQEKIRY